MPDLFAAAPSGVTALVLLLALAIDHRWGEPPLRWHPVAWMGQYLGALGQRVAPAMGDPVPAAARVFVRAAAAWLLGALLVAGIAQALDLRLGKPGDVGVEIVLASAVLAGFLWSLFA